MLEELNISRSEVEEWRERRRRFGAELKCEKEEGQKERGMIAEE